MQRQLRPLEGYQDLPERLRAAGPILDKQDVRIDEEDEKVVSTDSMSQRARQALCYGLFGNVTHTVPGRRSYRTVDGHGTVAYIHPSSVLFGADSTPE